MNDEEINEIIARNEDEVNIFRELDIKRERDALEAWRAAGHKGKPPPPLMQLEELPEIYQIDEPFQMNQEAEEMYEGRGARKRTVVSYNDGLDDDTWAMVSSFSVSLGFDSGTSHARVVARVACHVTSPRFRASVSLDFIYRRINFLLSARVLIVILLRHT